MVAMHSRTPPTPQPPLESMNICVQTFTTLRDDILDYIRHPRFKHLILNNCGVPLSSTRLSGLSSLYVTIPGRHLPFTPVNFLGLVQLLRQNPGLVSLTLIGVLSAEERLANSPSLGSRPSPEAAIPQYRWLNARVGPFLFLCIRTSPQIVVHQITGDCHRRQHSPL